MPTGGSFWKFSQLQCKLATSEESRGLEIQNQLLDDMKTDLQEFPGRRRYVDVESEGPPPHDAGAIPPVSRHPADEEMEVPVEDARPRPATPPQPEPKLSGRR